MTGRGDPPGLGEPADAAPARTRRTVPRSSEAAAGTDLIQGFDKDKKDGRGSAGSANRMYGAANVPGVDDALREEIFQGFAGRATVGLAEAAKILKMHVKTLRLHISDGNVGFIQRGTGPERPRRIFTPTDLLDFYAGQRRRAIARGHEVARPAGRRQLNTE